MIKFVLGALVAAASVLATACSDGSVSDPTATSPSNPTPTATQARTECVMLQEGDAPSPPCGALDTSKSYTAEFVTENGSFTVELLDDTAPLAVENFVNLARIGFYDDTTFHRVLENFMAQGGDPTGTGSGGPGYRFPDQFDPAMKHDSAGMLSMANAGFNTNGSQFFITFGPQSHLDPYDSNGELKQCELSFVSCHMVFGKVISGMDIVHSISLRDPRSATTPGDALLSVNITES